MVIYFQSIFLNILGILPSIFSKFTFQKFMLFNQTNQFKKQEFQTVKKKEQTDSMVITLENAIYMGKMILLLSLTQSYFYMNTSQLTILICHCVIYSIFRVNIRNWWIRNPFILPYYRKYLHHNLSYFTMEQKRKKTAG